MWDLKEVEKKVAVADEKGAVTFGKVLNETKEINKIINSKCVILMLCENSVGSYLGYYAFTSAECVVILLESSIKEEYCQNMIEKYRP